MTEAAAPGNVLGPMVRARRTARGMTQWDLADLIGKQQADVSKLERGAYDNPGDEVLRALADALDLPFADLVLARAGVHPAAYREMDVEELVYDAPRVKRYRIDGRENGDVPVLAEWLDGRATEDFFILSAPNDQLAQYFIKTGDEVLFRKLADERPENGELVACRNSHGWYMTAWDARITDEPLGRYVRRWEP